MARRGNNRPLPTKKTHLAPSHVLWQPLPVLPCLISAFFMQRKSPCCLLEEAPSTSPPPVFVNLCFSPAYVPPTQPLGSVMNGLNEEITQEKGESRRGACRCSVFTRQLG